MRGRSGILAILLACFAQDAQAIIFYRITGLSDFNLPNWSITDPAISTSMDLCVYTTLAGSYAITATSVTGFTLVSGLNTIAYTLSWEDSGAGALGSNGGTAMTNNVALTNRQHSNSSLTSTDCSTGAPAGANARLYFKITKAAMTAAKGSATPYTGTLLLTVSAM